ncbi:MAG: PDGLE domain-containing protein [Endomicrobium sp.]|jgi:cobalt/nickel transport protein|nr:PDGLE domain-containing protein [Endomicrobium sp.]
MNKKTFVITIPILVVLLASLFASKRPDTLETIAINYGFKGQAKEISSLFTGYSFPFIHNQFMSSFCAGIMGLFIIYVLYKVVKRFVK